ncbi:MAG: DcaP family trimeric outer membrane transporter [Saprospiraceae bacterium]|nr:DcaP family trimeric outer membrane transporter [Saprospiraceae bacterium]
MAQEDGAKTMEIYGFVMTDVGYNFNQIQSEWFDVVRPTKLPTFENEYGTNGNVYFSVRQTRFGAKNYFQTSLGELFTQFEWELFGVGADAGQTTFRLRHAYGQLGKFGAGQYWSPFMDIDIFPNSLEYWGPSGMVFFRNLQVRYMPIQGDSRLTIALERPGATGDEGVYADRLREENLRGRSPMADLSAEYRHSLGSGRYVELAGIVRHIEWEDLDTNSTDLSGSVVGWGFNLTTNLKLGAATTFRGGVVYGAGIQNYMNDAEADMAIDNREVIVLPQLGISAFIDHQWNEKFSSAVGYSLNDVDNGDGQLASAFNSGSYALANLLYYPAKNAMAGVELQYGNRRNKAEDPVTGFDGSEIVKIQFSFKYNFSQSFYSKKS